MQRARDIQRERCSRLGLPEYTTNARCSVALIETVTEPDAGAMSLLQDASEKLGLSARGYHRVLKERSDLTHRAEIRRLILGSAAGVVAASCPG